MKKSINVLNPEFFAKKYEPLKLNLQHFAEPEPEPTPEPEPSKLELTEEELQKKIEAESDRKLQSALEKKKAEWEEEKKAIEANAKKTAEEYAKMTQKEKEDAEYQKRLKQLEERERELNNKQLTSEIESDLKEKSLPASVSDLFVLIGDNEKIKERISSFEKEVNDFINERVKEALRQDPPETGNSRSTGSNFNKSKSEMAKKARII